MEEPQPQVEQQEPVEEHEKPVVVIDDDEKTDGSSDNENVQEVLDQVIETTKPKRKQKKKGKSRAEILATARAELAEDRALKKKKLELFESYLNDDLDIDENVLKSNNISFKRNFKKGKVVPQEQPQTQQTQAQAPKKQKPYWQLDLSNEAIPDNFW